MRKPLQEDERSLYFSYSEIMKDLPQHTPDERDELERDKVLHAQLIEVRRFSALCRWGIKARKFHPSLNFN